ncbi:MAG: DUF4823 domain-containing protein [Candidatus Omnitrophica bacterium]|nr:DUF4823 domain-containing protein [Candidatus Omnitrophota bacterium]
MKKVFVLLLCLGTMGCASIEQVRLGKYSSPPKLNPEGSAYILSPKDGRYMDREYKGSGLTTGWLFRKSFSEYLQRVETSVGTMPFEKGFEEGKKLNFMYFVYPQILHWEDRATEWSGAQDKVNVKADLFDIRTEQQLDSVMIKSKGTWFTLGGYHPQDILEKAIDEYVDSLF